jgi:hypothetical protein
VAVGRGAGGELTRLVDLFEIIKEIAALAFKLRLLAVNAIVTSRSQGATAPGFDVVAAYMGQLSKELDEAMTQLRPEVTAWVRAASLLVKLERSLRLLGEARKLEDTGAAANALASARARVGALRRDLLKRKRRVADVVDDVSQLTAGGCGAARSAKVEAAYGGEFRLSLGAVADELAAVTDSVYVAAYNLRRRASAPLGIDVWEEWERDEAVSQVEGAP